MIAQQQSAAVDTALEADRLTLWRGERCLLNSLSFRVQAGEALVIRGANGIGKTSLLRLLCGLATPEQGKVLWCGSDIRSQRQVFNAALAWAGHSDGHKPDLTAAENLAFDAALRTSAGEAFALEGLGISSFAQLPVRSLSAGQRRRVALARVLASGARLWLLDEPFTHLDDPARAFMQATLASHVSRGGIAVLAIHGEHGLPHSFTRELLLGAAS